MATFTSTGMVRTARAGALLLVASLSAQAAAAPPLVPLPAPAYSFDLDSPTVIGGWVDARDVLQFDFPQPAVLIPGENLELLSPFDDLDCLSGPNDDVGPLQPFVLLFSVDRQTVGTTPPDPGLVMLGVPYNVQDQAQRGQAAGDQYLSLELFSREGTFADLPAFNAVLNRNNFDEGGTSFSAAPAVAAYTYTTAGQDNTNATGSAPQAADVTQNVYFSVTRESPSLLELPGFQNPSGAHIFFNPDPLNFTPTQLYAPFYELGLSMFDDIDAMVVFDVDVNGLFGGMDVVLFSLTPDSPSLLVIPGASPAGAGADVFRARPGQPPEIYANANMFGLGAFEDNIDALEFAPCDDPFACAELHGIRVRRGDLNCDDMVDFGDINPFVLALSDPGGYWRQFPECDIMHGDINGDMMVDFGDINPFVALLTNP